MMSAVLKPTAAGNKASARCSVSMTIRQRVFAEQGVVAGGVGAAAPVGVALRIDVDQERALP